jgi:hypothetical protein
MKPTIYISGPITGLPDLNRPAFNTAARALRAAGFVVVNPIDNGLPDSATWAQHLRADIRLLMNCNAVATLPGHMASKGARLELHNARALGMPVMTVEQWLEQLPVKGAPHITTTEAEAA